ncbi:pyridoxal-phosphate dependent enzyme [Saccharopolyspora indica]|uniref:pyridoxal-phosphate dependent enzyme n=1 Tax=Saccharopolyspora indica TaxID=1229659 RepID=UPI0022EB39D6|nr:pyridoxal-phosphate dependent enzyme [Saccharopolyspora indica]MDA3643165.1 pyridoxal-phosphate dependent enzyme [Saccharopolyspora indica]
MSSEIARLPWYTRPESRSWTCAPAPAEVRRFHASLPGYVRTPLTEIPSLAAELGVGRVFVKDESDRLGLPAFKVLGVSWAVHRLLAEQAGRLRLVTATDGNHGRALAHIARRLGHSAHVFVPRGVHPAAVAAIAAEGAQVTVVDDTYDTAVRAAADAAGSQDAVLVQDTALPGHERIPAWIVEGYSTLFAETDEQLTAAGAGPAGLVAVPAGVGSLAQAAVTHYRSRTAASPAASLMTVEPTAAAAVLHSLRSGRPTAVRTGETAMTGLVSENISSLAWPHLRDGVDAAVAITDAEATAAARDLGAAGVSAGPCGAAALAGLRAALSGQEAEDRRAALGLGPASTVVLLNTEGTDANPHWEVGQDAPETGDQ